jgi:hypothetical protein
MTVNALPDAGTIAIGGALCPGRVVSLSGTTAGGTWSGGTTGIATIGTSGSITCIAPGTTTITYMVGNSCGSDAVVLSVTVNTPADAGRIFGENSICPADSSALVTTGATGGVWLSDAPGIVSVRPNGVVTGNTPGSATIWYIVASACGADTATWVVTVKSATECSTLTGVLQASTVQVYPNPSRGNFVIEVPVAGTVELSCMDGRIVYQNKLNVGINDLKLAATNMTAGIYMCHVTLADGVIYTQRIVITP